MGLPRSQRADRPGVLKQRHMDRVGGSREPGNRNPVRRAARGACSPRRSRPEDLLLLPPRDRAPLGVRLDLFRRRLTPEIPVSARDRPGPGSDGHREIQQGRSWSGSSSFMVEGIAKYAEAMATDPEVNHRQTAEFLRLGRLYPLNEMLTFEIGSHAGTDVAYPAAGSFVHYLLDTYSLGQFKDVYQLEAKSEEQELESIWQKAFGKSIRELETDWRAWLSEHYL